MSETTTTFGIDLGTTYSCISYLKDGHPTVCKSIEGDYTTPSVVRMTDDEIIVGKTAKDTSILFPDDTIQFVKSRIGRDESFDIGAEDNRRTVTPIQVSAEILKKLASDASAYSGMPVKDVVITVPAYFGNNEKDATKKAGIEAGLNVVRLVEEPTAAAFYYLCETDDTDATVCVYDLGGGTFDVTAIEKEGKEIRVLTTDGDHDLGGKNWDETLINYVEEQFREATGLDPDEELDTDFRQDLQIKCEDAKKQLTSANQASIALKYDRQHMANIVVTREQFNEITAPLLQTTIDLTEQVLNAVETEHNKKIDKLLLVGGSSKMPQVKDAIVEAFGDRIGEVLINDPDESVSKGACIFCAWSLMNMDKGDEAASSDDGGATVVDRTTNEETGEVILTIASTSGETHEVTIASLPGGVADTVFRMVATKSFGILTLDSDGHEMISNLILKDEVLPAVFEQTFGTHSANATNLNIALYQSEIKDKTYETDYGVMIGESTLSGLPEGLPAHEPVQIRITLNEEGIIEVTGSHKGNPLEGCLNTSYAEGVGKQ